MSALAKRLAASAFGKGHANAMRAAKVAHLLRAARLSIPTFMANDDSVRAGVEV